MSRLHPEPLSVYDFDDYRKFLDAWLKEKRARSVRSLATRLGCSPSYISMVRSGRRNLSLEHARHWSWGMRLESDQADFWQALVRRVHGPTPAIRNAAQAQIDAARAWQEAVQEHESLRLISDWYVQTIIEFGKCPGFQPDAEWIAERLVPPISVEEAQGALDLLFEIGAFKMTDEGLKVTDKSVATELYPDSPAMRDALLRGHRAWLELGLGAIHHLHQDEHYLAQVTMSLDSTRLREITETITRILIEGAQGTVDHQPDRAYTLGLALLPRSAVPGED